MNQLAKPVVLSLTFLLMGIGIPVMSQNDKYLPISQEVDIGAKWASFQPAGVSPSDSFLEAARRLAPYLCLAMVHESDFDLTRDDLREIDILPAKDQNYYFSGSGLQRVAPDLGWVEISIETSQLDIYTTSQFKKSEKYSDFVGKLTADAPALMSQENARLAMLTIEVLTYGGDSLPIEFPLIEDQDGHIYAFPRWFMEGGHTSGGIRVNPETVDPEVRERLERRVAEQQRQIAAQTQPVETRRAQPTSYSRYLIWGGIVCLVLGVFFVLVRKSQTA